MVVHTSWPYIDKKRKKRLTSHINDLLMLIKGSITATISD
jgi:hypothetical protein